jgi:ubiquinol-cytochrome c reductase iron-sulfur subunit
MARRDRPKEGFIGVAFLLSVAASLGLTVVYALGGQPQLEGALLTVALGGIAIGLVLATKGLLPPGPDIQERGKLASTDEERGKVFESFTERSDVGRRNFLVRSLVAAVGALGIAALFPIRSPGTRPGRELFGTAWRDGSRMVTDTGQLLRGEDIEINGVVTVFPEGFQDAADSQTVLIRLPIEAAEEVEGVGDLGLIAFSKICTHAGCPVGLYQAETYELFCPCHQSVFEVLRDAAPNSGPATRPLPRLPIGLDDDGYVVALGDYPEPVGPGFWSRGRD